MKRKFISIFVALSLAATMFSGALAFAEENESLEEVTEVESGEIAGDEAVSALDVTISNVRIYFDKDGIFTFSFVPSDSGSATLTLTKGETEVATASTGWEGTEYGIDFAFGEGEANEADSITLVVYNLDGTEAFRNTYPVPNLDFLKDFTVTRTGTNEITVTFTSDRAGVFSACVYFECGFEPGKLEHFNSANFGIGENKLVLKLVTDDYGDEYLNLDNAAKDGYYMFNVSFETYDAYYVTGWITIPAFEVEAAKSLIPKSGDSNRGAAVVVLIGAVALGAVSFRAMKKAQKNAA